MGMKILVTGCEGMLGRAVTARLTKEHEVLGVDLQDGDLVSLPVVEELFQGFQPGWVVNCAAWTGVDSAETQRDQAMAANAGIPRNLAHVCDARGCGLTQVSTDYVFPGTGMGFDEESPLDPVNYYGLTKAEGEAAVKSMTAPWQIVRTSWLFGDGPQNFVRTIANLLTKRETLKVVSDQNGNPSYTEDLAEIIAHLVTGGYQGIFHATNKGSCSWFEFAQAIAIEVGTVKERILACTSSEYPTPAVRPACSILRSSHLEEVGCPVRPSWENALHRYFSHLKSGRARFPLG